jgi:hypothetical protein
VRIIDGHAYVREAVDRSSWAQCLMVYKAIHRRECVFEPREKERVSVCVATAVFGARQAWVALRVSSCVPCEPNCVVFINNSQDTSVYRCGVRRREVSLSIVHVPMIVHRSSVPTPPC